MSAYLDQILGIYAPDVPGVREALTAIVEAEIASRDPVSADQAGDYDMGGRIVAKKADGSWLIDTVTGRRRRVWFLCSECQQPVGDTALRARAERAEADAATLRAATQWQPMATAPRDGTQVWAWDVERGANPSVWVLDVECWVITYDDAVIQPTHWMPLPAKPTVADITSEQIAALTAQGEPAPIVTSRERITDASKTIQADRLSVSAAYDASVTAALASGRAQGETAPRIVSATARCRSCGDYTDDITFEYASAAHGETAPATEIERERDYLREVVARQAGVISELKASSLPAAEGLDAEGYRRLGVAGDLHAETAYAIASGTFGSGSQRDFLCRKVYTALRAVAEGRPVRTPHDWKHRSGCPTLHDHVASPVCNCGLMKALAVYGSSRRAVAEGRR